MQSVTSVLITDGQRDISDRRGEGNVTKEVEIRMRQPQGKECSGHWNLEEERNVFSPSIPRRNIVLLTSEFWPPKTSF